MLEIRTAQRLRSQSQAIGKVIDRLLAHGNSLEEIKTALTDHSGEFDGIGKKLSVFENTLRESIERQKSTENAFEKRLKEGKTESEKGLNSIGKRILDEVSELLRAEKFRKKELEGQLLEFSRQINHSQENFSALLHEVSGLKKLAADRENAIREKETVQPLAVQPVDHTQELIDTFTGNWDKNRTYERGQTFAFRGGFYIVLKTVRGKFPTYQLQTGPDPTFSVLAAPGSPGPRGADGTGSGGSGVTSVGLSAPSIFAVTGSPVTNSGTLALAFNTQAKGVFFSGPGSGADAVPTFRALLATDIPDLSALYDVAGSAASALTSAKTYTDGKISSLGSLALLNSVNNSNWSGTALAIGNGGTGQITALAAFNSLSPLTTLGDVLYGGASGSGIRLAGNTTTAKQFLIQTGTGSASAAPTWAALASTDIPWATPGTIGSTTPNTAKFTTLITNGALSAFTDGTVGGIGGGGGGNFQVASDATANFNTAFMQFSASTGGVTNQFLKSRNATIGSHSAVLNGDTIAQLQFGASDGSAFIRAARIIIAATSDFASSAGTSDMIFGVSTANSFIEAARFVSDKTLKLSGVLQLGSTYSAGVVVSTGTIPIKDSTGTTYNVLVHT